MRVFSEFNWGFGIGRGREEMSEDGGGREG